MSRYIVIKRNDVEKHLKDCHRVDLGLNLNLIEQGREKEGKPPVNHYLVLNVDTPYAGDVYIIMHRHGHTPCADCSDHSGVISSLSNCNVCAFLRLRQVLLRHGLIKLPKGNDV